MSATEWIGASHVTRSACGSRSSRVAVGQRRVLEPRLGERVDDATVEIRIRRVVDDGPAVVALEVDRVDTAELDKLGDHVVAPARPGVELEAQTRGRERGYDRRRSVLGGSPSPPEATKVTGRGSRSDGVAERPARLSQREIEGGALESPPAIVDVRVLRGLARRKGAACQVLRERIECPVAGQRQHGSARLLALVLVAVVRDVLADTLLAGTQQAHDGRSAGEIGTDGRARAGRARSARRGAEDLGRARRGS